MRFEKVSSTILETVHSNHSLSSYLTNLYVKGREATPRSWFYENVPVETLLKEVRAMYTEANKGPYEELFNQVEESNLEKFGPQGKVPPVKHSKAWDECLDPIFCSSAFDDEGKLAEFFPYTKEFAKYLFGSRLMTKRRKSFERVIDDMQDRDTLNTNSGYPRFTERNSVVVNEIADAKSGKAFDYPAILLGRHYHGKLRPVWMYPMSMNLLEYQFSQVIQDVLRQSSNPNVKRHLSPWEGYEDVKKTLTLKWLPGMHILGGDTTKMDAHMRKAQIRLFYEITKWLFQRQEWDQWYRVCMRVCNIELLIDTDKWLNTDHGLASGSGITQLSETVLVMFILWMNGILESQGIGDDFYAITDNNGEWLVRTLDKYGLPAKPEKQTDSSEYLDFLQRRNVQGFFSREFQQILGGYYSIIRALNSWVLPEKFHKPKQWNSDMYNARFFMIAENIIDDPAARTVILWAAKGQKDTIAFAKKSPAELAQIQKQARLVPGLNPSYNQEKRRKPLSQFYSIQLVRDEA